ncbi:hypothetical protein AcW1_008266 [Taiwanofungus camphoratus]|nr:hypothetical protein AcW1_008266 [Antrodia cinnamomea]KAI0956043.1 hypothetical protein AcV7_006551 [Antrodia cinnamomea]
MHVKHVYDMSCVKFMEAQREVYRTPNNDEISSHHCPVLVEKVLNAGNQMKHHGRHVSLKVVRFPQKAYRTFWSHDLTRQNDVQ